MDKTEASSVCRDILNLSRDVELVTAVAYPSGEALAIESRIPRGNQTSRKHFGILATIMRDHLDNFEAEYGKCSYFLFNFAKGQAIIFLTGSGVIVVGTNPQADPKIITAVADRLKGV
jgi:hypothetical protein